MNTKIRDPLLEAVGRQLGAEDGLDDPCWNDLAQGSLPAGEVADLEAKAARGEAHALAFEAFRPIDTAERDAIADSVLAALAAPTGTSEPPGSPPRKDETAVETPALPANDAPEGARVIPLRPRRATTARLFGVAASLAAAAALVLFLRAGGPGPVPGYAAVVEGGRSDHRATPAAVAPGKAVTLGPEERLRVVLRPETEVPGPVTARAFIAGPTGLQPIDARVEQAPHGSLVVPEIGAAMLGGVPAGEYDLLFVVARPDAMPAAAEVARAAGGDAGGAFRILRVRVAVGARP